MLRLVFLSVVLVPLACSDDDDDDTGASTADTGSTTADTGSSDPSSATEPDGSSTDPTESSVDPSSATTETSSTDATGASTESSTTGPSATTGTPDCVEVHLTGDPVAVTSDVFRFIAVDFLGDANTEDIVQLEFHASDTGMFDLGVAPNDNFQTCGQCVVASEDEDAVFYFQSAGSIEIADDPTDGSLVATLTGVRLHEVTIDLNSFESTLVPGGGCVDIADADVATAPVPREWTCDPSYFGGDGGCDCGCGVLDPDCTDASVEACDYCNDIGSCSEDAGDCPGIIDPDDNAACV